MNAKLQMLYKSKKLESGDEKHPAEDDNRVVSRNICVEVDTISDTLDDLSRQLAKIRQAEGRCGSMKQLAEGRCSKSVQLLSELAEILPDLRLMYERELECKRRALSDMGLHENRDVFTAALISYKYEPFLDHSVLNRLYALVCDGNAGT